VQKPRVVSQVLKGPVQSVLPVHWMQLFVAKLHLGSAPGNAAWQSRSCVHLVHIPVAVAHFPVLPAEAGPQSKSAAHWPQEPIEVMHLGSAEDEAFWHSLSSVHRVHIPVTLHLPVLPAAAEPQLVSLRHWTHRFVVVLHLPSTLA
jgi:hypothetical protein